jgi:hypothetical protein
MIILIAVGLAINKWLMLHKLLALGRAVKVQTWLMQFVLAEQQLLCRAHMKVLEESFASGELESDPANLEYFEDLRSLEAEGRYEVVLIQLYQLDKLMDEHAQYDIGNS